MSDEQQYIVTCQLKVIVVKNMHKTVSITIPKDFSAFIEISSSCITMSLPVYCKFHLTMKKVIVVLLDYIISRIKLSIFQSKCYNWNLKRGNKFKDLNS